MTDFTGRTVVVTGASGALGAGLATAFIEAGADVVGVDRTEPDERAVVDGVRYETVDLTDDAGVATLFDSVGTPWAVVNTVGGFAPQSPLSELDPEDLERQLHLNLMTAAVVTKHALRVMKPIGEGRIVLTSSRAATATKTNGFAYSVSKLAVLHLTQDGVRGGCWHRHHGQQCRAVDHRHSSQSRVDARRGPRRLAEDPRPCARLPVPGVAVVRRRQRRRSAGLTARRSAGQPAPRAAGRPMRTRPRPSRRAPGRRGRPCCRSAPRSGCRWSGRR